MLLLFFQVASVGGGTVPQLPEQEDGGVSAAAPPPRRYFVDLDGEMIPVRSEAEARQVLLDIAREEAQRLEAQAEALRLNTATTIGKVDWTPPQLSSDAVPVFEAQTLIDEAYQKAAEAAEAALAEQDRKKRQKQTDDEAVIRLLM